MSTTRKPEEVRPGTCEWHLQIFFLEIKRTSIQLLRNCDVFFLNAWKVTICWNRTVPRALDSETTQLSWFKRDVFLVSPEMLSISFPFGLYVQLDSECLKVPESRKKKIFRV